MSSKRMEARQVTVVKTDSTKHGASLKNSESNKLPCAPSNHKQSSEAEENTGHPKGNPVTAKTGKAFMFSELVTATKNFHSDCLLGEGGFGRVYKGKLQNGQLVAVKQLDLNGSQGNQEFIVEVMMLGLLHHANLVNLVGFCADGDQRLLVYEYMALGSLADHLLDTCRPACDQILVKWAKPMLKDRRRYHELVDPLLRGNYPKRDLNQAVGIAAMCLQEEALVRPYMSDAVVTLGFLKEVPEGYDEKISIVPQNKTK
ncbi:hypothetical protein ABZP36_029099 [Zizania latifolia]